MLSQHCQALIAFEAVLKKYSTDLKAQVAFDSTRPSPLVLGSDPMEGVWEETLPMAEQQQLMNQHLPLQEEKSSRADNTQPANVRSQEHQLAGGKYP